MWSTSCPEHSCCALAWGWNVIMTSEFPHEFRVFFLRYCVGVDIEKFPPHIPKICLCGARRNFENQEDQQWCFPSAPKQPFSIESIVATGLNLLQIRDQLPHNPRFFEFVDGAWHIQIKKKEKIRTLCISNREVLLLGSEKRLRFNVQVFLEQHQKAAKLWHFNIAQVVEDPQTLDEAKRIIQLQKEKIHALSNQTALMSMRLARIP